jgi:hypothetical protein
VTESFELADVVTASALGIDAGGIEPGAQVGAEGLGPIAGVR